MAQFMLILPELWLAAGAVVLLLAGAFSGGHSYAVVTLLAIGVLLAAIFMLVALPLQGTAFGTALILDPFARFLKILALTAAFIVLIMSMGAARAGKFDKFEFPVLALLASLGMLLMISAGNMLALYLGLELHSLALYVMAALNRDDARSTEAGLKYFVLGSLVSGLLLYGIALLYGYSGGHIDYAGLSQALGGGSVSLGLIFGLVFVLTGLAFKISAVPFHMWTPDVYEGAPTPITAFFATAAKVAAVAVLTRLTIMCFGAAAPAGGAMPAWQQILVFMALASMFLGAFAGIAQRNIKRLMAYSSITHIGYMLAALAAGSLVGVTAVLLYLLVYTVMMLGCFAFILAMNTGDGPVEAIDDLAGLSRANPFMAGLMTIFMFSLAGIPPLSGFFGKWYVFSAVVQVHFVPLAVAGMLAAVIAAFYYLRIIKIMWFDEPKGSFLSMPRALQLILLLSGLFTVFYLLVGGWFLPWAAMAAKSLF